MKSTERSIVINASPEKIWDLLAADRLSEWQPIFMKAKVEYITEIKTPEDKYKPGTIATFDVSCHHEISEAMLYKMVKYKLYEKSILGYFEGFKTFSIQQTDKGALFTYSTEFYKPAGFYAKILYFLTRRWIEKTIEAELRALKRVLEKMG